MISLIIPTLNASSSLAVTLASLGAFPGPMEIVVSDGGSVDDTHRIAAGAGARWITGPPGRGGQLRRGAAAARGDWLMFLHADTQLGSGWQKAVADFVADPQAQTRAGMFRLRLDDDVPSARRVERWANWRARTLGLPYGDQGLLIAREFYDSLGGFDDIPLMEDVAFVRRIGRKRLAFFEVPALTSAARYRRDGYWRRPLRNLVCLFLYYCGVAPARLQRMYER